MKLTWESRDPPNLETHTDFRGAETVLAGERRTRAFWGSQSRRCAEAGGGWLDLPPLRLALPTSPLSSVTLRHAGFIRGIALRAAPRCGTAPLPIAAGHGLPCSSWSTTEQATSLSTFLPAVPPVKVETAKGLRFYLFATSPVSLPWRILFS